MAGLIGDNGPVHCVCHITTWNKFFACKVAPLNSCKDYIFCAALSAVWTGAIRITKWAAILSISLNLLINRFWFTLPNNLQCLLWRENLTVSFQSIKNMCAISRWITFFVLLIETLGARSIWNTVRESNESSTTFRDVCTISLPGFHNFSRVLISSLSDCLA